HKFKDNVIYTYQDEYYAISEFSPMLNNDSGEFDSAYTYSDEFLKNRILPLYLEMHGESVEIGTCFANPNASDYDDPLMYIKYTEKTKAMIKTHKLPQKTHDESLEFFTVSCNVIERM
ncbi:MAG: hypothetical protein IJZ63_07205, partial [Clostridia bacterium]|nr:hypothetical protein [Clostridia bacterium]